MSEAEYRERYRARLVAKFEELNVPIAEAEFAEKWAKAAEFDPEYNDDPEGDADDEFYYATNA